jgi:hypothetical protein
MKRFLVALALWIAAVPLALAAPWPANCIHPIAFGQTVNGQLSDPTCAQFYDGGVYYAQVYAFSGVAGQQISIFLSSEFDSYVELSDKNDDIFAISPGQRLAWDGSSGVHSASILNFTLPSTLTYYIMVSPFLPFQTGNYSLALVGTAATAVTETVVEYYHAGLDHYFITWMPTEIAILDAGTQIRGWTRTGHSFKTYTTPQAGTSPVCRYYIPPVLGDSHFFGRGTVECNATGQKNPTFVLEDPAFMQTFLPAAGVCPANTTQVYRVFSNRVDANHRYMTDRTVRDQMVAKGWLAEGDGSDLVVMCAPQ